MNFSRSSFITEFKSKPYPNYWDLIALFFVLSFIMLLAWNAKQMASPYHVGEAIPISLDPHYLPFYALRTVLRMFAALIFSLLFTFTFATWAAKSPRAERIIIPLIDVMQSVPVLGYLSITVVGFISLFPGSMLGPECATIFATFTAQVWNMAFGFYQTVKSVPGELEEAADMFHLSAWQRFWRIEVPFSLPGLLWNTMMSMSASWFFVVVAESIYVNNQQILLPGVGSYITVAIQQMDMKAILYAIFTMLVVIVIYDQILFRPVMAWAEKFKGEQVSSEHEVYSWLINLLHRTRFLRYIGQKIESLFNAFVNIEAFRSKPKKYVEREIRARKERIVSSVSSALLIAAISVAVIYLGHFIFEHVLFSTIWHVLILGLITSARVFILIVLSSLIWVPVGVWVGLRPDMARIVQPIAQIFAAFPANVLYPLVVIFIVEFHLNANIFLSPLMILGAQWYILFNVIAGASVIPKDLLQAADNFGLSRSLRWRRLLLPAIFPYYVTGAITAAGGAWNASIVAEVANWGNDHLVATGLGAYIQQYTSAGDFVHIAIGIGMMCILVLTFNHFIWRPLYFTAVSRYQLD